MAVKKSVAAQVIKGNEYTGHPDDSVSSSLSDDLKEILKLGAIATQGKLDAAYEQRKELSNKAKAEHGEEQRPTAPTPRGPGQR